ncbi:MAG: hypothetical protein H6742_03640 [Alphaproteobacteria bacterium]|nr:hypothetical protein [Alphaproteobacteria bacterium]
MSPLLFLLACAGEGPADTDSGAGSPDYGECGNPDDSWVGVMTSVTFARRADDGTTVGFDLDDHVSENGDSAGCGHADLSSADGVEGIDSAFSGLWPALAATEAGAVEGLMQDSITNGELLLILELERLDDVADDECVDLNLWRGTGTPLVGTDGVLLDSQTFATTSTTAPSSVPGIAVADGIVEGGPFDFDLPLQVLDVELDFHITGAYLHAELVSEDEFHGYLAGVVPLEDILLIAAEEDLGSTADLLENLVTLAADIDLSGGGACDGLSIVLEFTGTRAFLYE